jgi:glucose dehydrogenase
MEASMSNKQSDSDQEPDPAMLSRREALKASAAAAIMTFFGRTNSIAQATASARASARIRYRETQWSNYGGDKASSKYSPLAQIRRGNFSRLKTAWTWRSAEEEVANVNHLKTWYGICLVGHAPRYPTPATSAR